ncbi:agmatine deiminase [Ruminococcus sp.]|uniref:agmatine deiminase n=1 Tax=Ruminococcus sp. TaxID=41978 RepID=UPI0025FC4F32|nr:agmatine deiminase [Ruminococcus sp.]
MQILHTTPRGDGFAMPAEFDRHDSCLMIWPIRGDSWRRGGWPARDAFVAVASAIAQSENVTMLVDASQYETARTMLPPEVRLVELSTDDAWARDVCPTFVRDRAGNVRGVDWGFNAWGGLEDGLYFPWDKDNHVARKVCDLFHTDCYDCREFILEGGSIHSDGDGTILTTKSCLLSAGRNPHMTQAEIEDKLCDMLNARKVLWLPRGIYADETNEHVDNIGAFTAPGKVVLAWTDDQSDPQYALSKACEDYLLQQTDACGRKIAVTRLPIPQTPVCITEEECRELDLWDGEPTRTPGERLAASYVNFYIANEAVLVPQFGDPMDKTACEILAAQFPTRNIVPIAAREILLGGGNIHCITQQIPHSERSCL